MGPKPTRPTHLHRLLFVESGVKLKCSCYKAHSKRTMDTLHLCPCMEASCYTSTVTLRVPGPGSTSGPHPHWDTNKGCASNGAGCFAGDDVVDLCLGLMAFQTTERISTKVANTFGDCSEHGQRSCRYVQIHVWRRTLQHMTLPSSRTPAPSILKCPG